MKKIKVVELFAGVGGFRLGLEGWRGLSSTSQYKDTLNSSYEVVWSNQWEPSTKTQHASCVYENRWGTDKHSNNDLEEVVKDCDQIPDMDMLVGGFPCQDYSVATTLKNSKGLIGKKGVLWWSIHKILSDKKNKPKYLFLENVDRLLNSPSKQRGRDFAIILQSLNELGYAVEWRVINAADYGFPQRRRRTFILAYHSSTAIYKKMAKELPSNWILEFGIMAETFPASTIDNHTQPSDFTLEGDIVTLSENFNIKGAKTPFENTGVMINGKVTTIKTASSYEGECATLKDVLVDIDDVPEEFFISIDDQEKWEYLKGSKKEIRKNAEGFEYNYSEGGMIFPEPIDRPSRTIITGEGGKSPSRFKHVIQTKKGLRRLTPVELERLNMFPDRHTEMNGVSDTKRAFFMGNALVVGVIEKIGTTLAKRIS
ncbi:DNA (cytosine-5-)-methyltransferase [Chryseobacterium sp. LC2016-27]|uniref:DNA (cytosine-5-)-methyltransferase n=1 Tax=Chryseobacterium sp. LC2016-27 TaxID=2897326 RepID=UPI001E4045B2|nr:DNA (cytosine-5-)-methyltransferase [Chryseobacterium sp. LC2016-27]MCD0455111.1 DNA (cytosine-5-)-methyltransferase [Chryseobacterium sp. LC2016-27]